MTKHEQTTTDPDADSSPVDGQTDDFGSVVQGSDMGSEDEQTGVDSVVRGSDGDTVHLDDIEDGAGCTEIWEHLSEQRADDDD